MRKSLIIAVGKNWSDHRILLIPTLVYGYWVRGVKWWQILGVIVIVGLVLPGAVGANVDVGLSLADFVLVWDCVLFGLYLAVTMVWGIVAPKVLSRG